MHTVFGRRTSTLLIALGMLIAPAAAEEPIGTGTAFLINSEGWAVTNAHVVKDCTRVTATGGSATSDVKMDVRNDLAVLRISAVPAGVIRLRHAGARLGEDIAAFGYPLGSVLSSSVKVTTGNVNSLMGMGDDTRYLQISTPIQPGNSGGPVVDRRGALVGITTATLKPEAGGGALPQNVNFALRATLLQTFLESRGVRFEYAPEDAAELHTADLADKVQPAVVQLFCYGTNAESAQTEAAAATSVPAPDPYRPVRPFSILDNHDVVGFDYATLRNVSQQQCQQACSEDGHCNAVTYNKRERFCFLKDNAKILVKNSDAFAMVVGPLSSQVKFSSFIIGSGKDMPGSDYRSLKTNFIGCYLECEVNSICRAFSYVRKKRECWLKHSIGPVSVKPGVDSGMK